VAFYDHAKRLSVHFFTVSFITNPPQERVINESTAIISAVFKENMNKVELDVINFHTDLLLKTRANNIDFWNLLMSEQYSILK